MDSPEELFTTHINLCELYHGAYKSRNPEKNIEEIDKMLDFIGLLPFTIEIDKQFGQLIKQLLEKGTPIGEMDTLIAAFALIYDQSIVTRNIKHYNKTDVTISNF